MEIDPLEAVIAWLATALTSVSGRVAGKHRYGDNWSRTETGVSVHLDGGEPELYVEVAKPRLEIRIYADDQAKVVSVWRTLTGLGRNNARFVQTTSNGDALIHYFLPQTGLSLLYDDTLSMEMGVVFFESMISEEAVSS